MTMGKNDSRLDRRRFLLGASGAALALPMLEAFAPRAAFGAVSPAPKRLVVVVHRHGRVAGNGKAGQDNWSPRTTTGPLPATGDLSPMLAALGAIRNEIVTIDGIDNLVRHTTGNADGHHSGARTFLTCMKPKGDGTGGGPSIDFVAGQRLRASASQRSALVFPGSPLGFEYQYDAPGFYGANGTPPALTNSNPKTVLGDVFGAVMPPTPPPTKTLQARLTGRRASILDAVADSYDALHNQVGLADQQRLDQHATFIRSLETRFAGTTSTVTGSGCVRPLDSSIPAYSAGQISRGRLDGQITPCQIENLVMSLACDITRVASLHFQLGYDPVFASEFSGTSPFDGANNHHAIIHSTPRLSDPARPNLTQAFGYQGKMFTKLVTRLAQITDVDGTRLLDNTLVLWVSDMGYGSSHFDFNIPVVMAGMKAAFPMGQGRHVVNTNRRSLGDLYAQVLRMLGGTDQTFGATGTVGAIAAGAGLTAGYGYDGFVTSNLPLHHGTIPL
jgi:hypothetical protein